MERFRSETIQRRMLLLVALAVLPAMSLALWTARDERRFRSEQSREAAYRLALAASLSNKGLFDGAEQLLEALVRIEDVRTMKRGACDAILKRMLDDQPSYNNLGAANADGELKCSATPFRGRLTVADRTYFQRAKATGSFSVGDFQVGRITNKPGVNVARPIMDGARFDGIVFAALNLSLLDAIALSSDLPPGSAVLVVDREGTILTRYPAPGFWFGKSVADEPLVRRMIAEGDGTADLVGVDGVRRLHGFTRLAGVPGSGGAYLAIGVPHSAVFAGIDARLAWTIVALAGVGVGALLLAWTVGRGVLVGPVRRALEVEREAAARLQEADEAKNAFLTAVSHDLRNPLAAIRGYADLLGGKLGSADEATVARLAERISNNTRRIERLLASLLDVERLKRGDIEPVRTPVDVATVARRIAEEVEFDPARRPVVDVEPIVALVDEGQLERIIENLLANGQNHALGRDVSLSVSRTADGILVRVDDGGSGVPEGIRERIFEPFERDSTGPGFGIGLYLVRRFAELHGGRAWVEEAPGGGASFRVSLPCEVRELGSAAATSDPARPGTGADPGGRP